MEAGSQQAGVKLQHDGSRAAFMCGSTCLVVSDAQTSRSALLDDVCSSSDGNFELDVPLTLSQAQAWLDYVDVQLHGNDSAARISDATLLDALKAASFLQDNLSEALIIAQLSRALEPQWVPQRKKGRPQQSTSYNPRCRDPTPALKARAINIVGTAPPASQLALLAAVKPQPDTLNSGPVPTDWDAYQRLMDTFGYLLMLLPSTFHPAILLARFPSIHRHSSLTILPFPWCGTSPHLASPEWPCLAGQTLAAAATLCERPPQLELVAEPTAPLSPSLRPTAELRPLKRPRSPQRSPRCTAGASSSAAAAAAQHAGSSKVCVGSPAAASGPGDAVSVRAQESLTRLNLGLLSHSAACWCAGVAQLRQLRELHLLVLNAMAADVPELLRTAEAMPALRSLHLYCKWSMAVECSAVLELLAGLPRLVQLTALGLDNCFKSEDDNPTVVSVSALGAALQLSRLSGLTQLSLKRCKMTPLLARCLGDAVKKLPRLRDLCVQNCGFGDIVLPGLCYCNPEDPGLVGLQALNAGGYFEPDATEWHDLQRFLNSAAFPGMTSLRFAIDSDDSRSPWNAPLVAVAISEMTGLRSLMLPMCRFEDAGLIRLAELMPELRCLTQLDIGDNSATHEGVFAVLRAAAAADANGGSSLCWLSVCFNEIGPEWLPELARLVGALSCLEVVKAGDLGMEMQGAVLLLRGMRTLKSLHSVTLLLNAMDSGDLPDLSSALSSLTALTRFEWQVLEQVQGLDDCVKDAVAEVAPSLCVVECDWHEEELEGNPVNPFGQPLQC